MGLDPDVLEAARTELFQRAVRDRESMLRVLPALAGRPGILDELPACQRFAAAYPEIEPSGFVLRFSFIRISLRREAVDPAYHLDSDAATAVTGDPSTLGERLVRRVLLNLSISQERILHYLDVDPSATTLSIESSYACRDGPASARRSSDSLHGRILRWPRPLHPGAWFRPSDRCPPAPSDFGGAATEVRHTLYMAAFDASDLPNDEEFREAVRSHVEFGSKVALQNSYAESDEQLHPLREVPRWTWVRDDEDV